MGIDRMLGNYSIEEIRQLMIDVLQAGMYHWNVKTGEILIDDHWANIVGYTRDEVEPMNTDKWNSFLHKDDVEISNSTIGAVLSGKHEYYDIVYRMNHKSGSLVWVRSRGKVLVRTEDGDPLWVVGTHIDVTEIKERDIKLMEAVEYSEAKYRALYDNAPVGIYIHDVDTGEIVDANAEALDMLRVKTMAEIKDIDPWVDDEEYTTDKAKITMQKARTEGKQEFEWKNKRADGEEFYCNIRLVPIIIDEKERVMSASVDLTKIKKAELENLALARQMEFIANANKAKSDFLSNMSHDIRTPMNAIMGMLSIAKKDINDKEKLLNDLETIEISAKHLLNLINDVLDMSKIESGNITYTFEKIDIRTEIDYIRSVVSNSFEEKGISFVLNVQELKHPKVIYSALRIKRLLINILNNACKFTDAGGRVELAVCELESDDPDINVINFKISDTGIGMDRLTLNNLFKPFFRKEDGRVRNTEGTGLGLSIVKHIVDQAGGNITVESEVGKGSVFDIFMPLKIASAKKLENYKMRQSKKAKIRPDYIKNFNILLVEDHPINAMVATRLFEDAGAKVVHAENGLEAVKKFENSKPDEFTVIFMDIQMPEMNGYEATEKIRNSSHPSAKSVPILAMTANTFSDDVEKCLNVGMNEHISKPINFNDIILKLMSCNINLIEE